MCVSLQKEKDLHFKQANKANRPKKANGTKKANGPNKANRLNLSQGSPVGFHGGQGSNNRSTVESTRISSSWIKTRTPAEVIFAAPPTTALSSAAAAAGLGDSEMQEGPWTGHRLVQWLVQDQIQEVSIHPKSNGTTTAGHQQQHENHAKLSFLLSCWISVSLISLVDPGTYTQKHMFFHVIICLIWLLSSSTEKTPCSSRRCLVTASTTGRRRHRSAARGVSGLEYPFGRTVVPNLRFGGTGGPGARRVYIPSEEVRLEV